MFVAVFVDPLEMPRNIWSNTPTCMTNHLLYTVVVVVDTSTDKRKTKTGVLWRHSTVSIIKHFFWFRAVDFHLLIKHLHKHAYIKTKNRRRKKLITHNDNYLLSFFKARYLECLPRYRQKIKTRKVNHTFCMDYETLCNIFISFNDKHDDILIC